MFSIIQSLTGKMPLAICPSFTYVLKALTIILEQFGYFIQIRPGVLRLNTYKNKQHSIFIYIHSFIDNIIQINDYLLPLIVIFAF